MGLLFGMSGKDAREYAAAVDRIMEGRGTSEDEAFRRQQEARNLPSTTEEALSKHSRGR